MPSKKSIRMVRGDVPGPKARAVIKRTSKVISPSIARDDPLVVESAHGSVVTDVDGNRFIDFSSGIAVLSTGSTHPKVVAAAKRQLEKFIHFSYTDFYYENLVTLAEELCALAPGDGEKMVYWGNSGAEANEAAMKLARNYTKRPIFLAHSGGFHGRTMGVLSLTGSKPIHRKGASRSSRTSCTSRSHTATAARGSRPFPNATTIASTTSRSSTSRNSSPSRMWPRTSSSRSREREGTSSRRRTTSGG